MKDLRRRKLERLAQSLILPWERVTLPSLNNLANYPHFIQAVHGSLVKLKKSPLDNHHFFVPNFKDEPNLNGLSVISDYGGEHKGCKYRTYSFLVTPHHVLEGYYQQVTQLREKHKLNEPYKEINFKNLSHGPVERALQEYLQICSQYLIGMVITLVVSNDIPSLLVSHLNNKEVKNAIIEQTKLISDGDRYSDLLIRLKPKTLEKQLTMTHFVAYLLSWLAEDGFKVLWQSDNDAMFANDEHREWMGALLPFILKRYTQKEFPLIGMAQQFLGNNHFNDLLSVPDLVAGALEDFHSKHKTNEASEDIKVKPSTHTILKWLGTQGLALKHFEILLEYNAERQLRATPYHLTLNHPLPPSYIIIP